MPIHLPLYVDTYPHIRLIGLPTLAGQLKLTVTSQALFDFWDPEVGWRTLTPTSDFRVDNGHNNLLQHHLSLFKDLPIEKCPGLQEQIALQPLRSKAGKRLAGSDLTSPLKKTPHLKEATHVSSLTGNGIPNASSLSQTLQNGLPASVEPGTLNTPVSSQPSTSQTTSTTPVSQETSPPVATNDAISHMSIQVWHAGYERMKVMKDDDNIPEAQTFPTIFGFKYAKLSACAYKRDWDKAPKAFKTAFLKLGDVVMT